MAGAISAVTTKTTAASGISFPLLDDYNLVTFDLAIVGPNRDGLILFERTGTFAERCYLKCHGTSHNPKSY